MRRSLLDASTPPPASSPSDANSFSVDDLPEAPAAALFPAEDADTTDSLPTEDPAETLLEDPADARSSADEPLDAAAAMPAAVSWMVGFRVGAAPDDAAEDQDVLVAVLDDPDGRGAAPAAVPSFGRIGFEPDRWNSASRARRLVTCIDKHRRGLRLVIGVSRQGKTSARTGVSGARAR